MGENQSVEKLAEVLRMLANPVRLRMLALIAVKPRYAYELAKLLGLSYPLVHLHLTALERAGFIEGDYVGGPRTRKVYRLRDFELVISKELLRKLGERLESE
jgi:ArsR family transcriptional regulator